MQAKSLAGAFNAIGAGQRVSERRWLSRQPAGKPALVLTMPEVDLGGQGHPIDHHLTLNTYLPGPPPTRKLGVDKALGRDRTRS
jgi:hypothetical protein